MVDADAMNQFGQNDNLQASSANYSPFPRHSPNNSMVKLVMWGWLVV